MSKTPFVLIVEDDEWVAEQLARSLAGAGIRTEHAPHALAAIDMIDAAIPDVIVLDVLLAGPNAFTLLHELKSHADLAEIPVILCTASADQLVSEDLTAYGVTQVLDKATMMPDDLVTAVRKALP
jgi:CheY-like chemotaxis protein